MSLKIALNFQSGLYLIVVLYFRVFNFVEESQNDDASGLLSTEPASTEKKYTNQCFPECTLEYCKQNKNAICSAM